MACLEKAADPRKCLQRERGVSSGGKKSCCLGFSSEDRSLDTHEEKHPTACSGWKVSVAVNDEKLSLRCLKRKVLLLRHCIPKVGFVMFDENFFPKRIGCTVHCEMKSFYHFIQKIKDCYLPTILQYA